MKSLSILELFGRLLVVGLGNLVSPVWPIMDLLLKPYVDIKALLGSSNILMSYLELIAHFKALGPQQILFVVIPLLIFCLVLSVVYLFFCNWLGSRLARHFLTRLKPQVPA